MMFQYLSAAFKLSSNNREDETKFQEQLIQVVVVVACQANVLCLPSVGLWLGAGVYTLDIETGGKLHADSILLMLWPCTTSALTRIG